MHDDFQVHVLADMMKWRRQEDDIPYILVLGAGASISSGASLGRKIITEVTEAHSSEDTKSMTWEQKLDEFYGILDNFSCDERYAILERHIAGQSPSEGYTALAELIKAGYFNVIFSTNYDTFLEDALNDADLRRNDFDLLINGVDSESEMLLQFSQHTPKTKVVKLHGDLHRRQFAFTPDEIMQFSKSVEEILIKSLQQDIIISGHEMRDQDINRCIKRDGGSIWYVNPKEPVASDPIYQMLRDRPGEIIAGEAAYFDKFFTTLRSDLI
jgi:hypothetical protein